MNVVVVGAGIIGASISRQLAVRGAKVTVVEVGPAAATGATGMSWAWLNANAKKPLHYRDLNLRSMQLWQQQHADLCNFCGCLMLHDERPTDQNPTYPSKHITAGPALRGLEPGLNPELADTCQHAKLYTLEGWCDPGEATAAFLADAQAAGARVLFNAKVQHVAANEGRATAVACSITNVQQQEQQQQEEFPADVVVLAAGVETPTLCAQLGYRLPLLHKPAAVVLTGPLQPRLLRHMVVTDTVFILQRSDGRFLIGETQPAAASNTDVSADNATRILHLAASAVPALSAAAAEGVHVRYRPYPADGYPVVGWVPGCSNVYVAVTHSGMTLAPLLGELVAEEVMAALQQDPQSAKQAAELMAPYRPDRDFEAAVAAAAAQPGLSWAATLQPDRH